MLYEIYSALKAQLTGLALPQEWYNVQYDETMINENGLFIEFPDPLKFDSDSKQLRRAPVKIRIHRYSKALRTNDGIPDATVQAHEASAEQIRALLDGVLLDNTGLTRLKFTGWQHWHRWKGWMVTFIEFEAKKAL